MTVRPLTNALVRLLVATLVVGVGVKLYDVFSVPDPTMVGQAAERFLADTFGPDARIGGFTVDMAHGVEVTGLRVPATGGPGTGLAARRVLVRHSLLDLCALAYRPTRIEVEGARLRMRESEAGLVLDFPLELGEGRRGGDVPELEVRDAELTVLGRAGSERLAPGAALRITGLEGSALRSRDGRLVVRGSFHVRGLGQDDTEVSIDGSGDPRSGALDVLVVWDPLRITPELLGSLSSELAEALGALPVGAGRLEARLVREGGAGEAGELVVTPRWIGAMTSDVGDLPGLSALAPDDKARLRELFGGGVLDVAVEGGRLVLRSLSTQAGAARVTASGWVEPDGSALELVAVIEDLSLEDPALRRALGPAGAEVLDLMVLRGRADARITIRRPAGGALTWEADVALRKLAFSYLGKPDATGRRMGFPYLLEDGAGRVHVGPEGVRVDGIEGRHGTRTVLRVLPSTRPSWQGEESGWVRFGPGGPGLRITLEAFDIAVDDDLRAAVEGSEFHGLLDTYRVEGVLDRVEVDLRRIAGVDDAVRSEVRVTLDGERFRWSRFPVPIEGLRGVVTLRRPVLPAGEPRVEPGPVGRVLWLDVRGEIPQAGAPAAVQMRVDLTGHQRRGRLHLRGRGVDLGGPLSEQLRAAELTREGLGALWAWLAPEGAADIEAEFPLEDDPEPLRILARLDGNAVSLDAADQGEAALRIEGLKGVVTAVGTDVRAQGLEGLLLGAPLEVSGRWPRGGSGPFQLDARTRTPVPFTSGFLEAVQQLSECTTFFPYGLVLEPGGEAALDMTVRLAEGADCPDVPRLVLRDLDLGLRWPQGPLLGLQGALLVFDEGEVTADRLDISMPGLAARIDGARHGPGGLRGRFDFRMQDFRIGEEMLEVLPAGTRTFLEDWTGDRRLSTPGLQLALERDGSVALGGELTLLARAGAPPGGAPRGRLALEGVALGGPGPDGSRSLRGTAVLDGLSIDPGLSLSELRGRLVVEDAQLGAAPRARARIEGLDGRVQGVRFEGVGAPIDWREGLLVAEPIEGLLSGGRMRATLRLSTGASSAYEGRLEVRDLDVGRLKDDLAPTGAPYAGRGTVVGTFRNPTGTRAGLQAQGVASVREGRLGELPAVANLFLALGSMLPGDKRPAFETLDATFTLADEVVRLDPIVIAGPMTTLPGRGRIDLEGQVDVTFKPHFIKSLLLPALMPLPVIGGLLQALLREDLVYAVRVHGEMGNPRTDVVFLPFLRGEDEGTWVAPPPPRAPRRPLPSTFR
ncbi:MAG: AsmA-like C-terminal region-containing protein [Planctomycetia bacterium]